MKFARVNKAWRIHTFSYQSSVSEVTDAQTGLELVWIPNINVDSFEKQFS